MTIKTFSTDESKLKPILSKKSALPHRPLADLFPCFATLHPAEAATIAAAVLMLNVSIKSPPVPQLSIREVDVSVNTETDSCFSTSLMIFISLFVVPAAVKAVKKEAITASDISTEKTDLTAL
ncbi:MAG TPA: hypothetical protein VFI64_04745 [Nitrososphaeraceae archaeon]|nr:hypothetical protein [Nitrososphaeraceae archaeon]